MSRSKAGAGHHNRKVNILKNNKGYQGKAKNCYSIAIRAFIRAKSNRYISRKLFKRDMRRQWIVNINEYFRRHGIKYNQVVALMHRHSIDRKTLSNMIDQGIDIYSIFYANTSTLN